MANTIPFGNKPIITPKTIPFGSPPIASTQQQKPSILSSVVGGLTRTLSSPESLLTSLGKAYGGVLGALSEMPRVGAKASLSTAKGYLKEAGQEIMAIPKDVTAGFEQGWKAPQQANMPSKVLGQTGLKGLAVDIMGDPLNLFFLNSVRQTANVAEKSTVAERFAGDVYETILNPPTKGEAKEIARIGQEFENVVKSEPELLGQRLSSYGIKGPGTEMIKEMNTKLPYVGGELKYQAMASDALIDGNPILQKLNNLKSTFETAKETTGVKEIDKAIKGLNAIMDENGKIPVWTALNVKDAYDDMRLTTQGLSESYGLANRIRKLIGDGLRGGVNKIPELGELNKEYSTYKDSVLALSRVTALSKKAQYLPLVLKPYFPYVKFSSEITSKVGTNMAQTLIKYGVPAEKTERVISEIIKNLTPSVINHVLEMRQ